MGEGGLVDAPSSPSVTPPSTAPEVQSSSVSSVQVLLNEVGPVSILMIDSEIEKTT